ncbi:class I SAM-dependent methyltransferase [Rhodococcus sp. (in: high G+C Gram-positive bacteria)]|uniref:class I SAM-dependent methyltransferase n=1 Tax=Rhodococcus sp. TaxID=1831 RepID=UPI0025798E27|nr:class I SAM-dependent methyltransferase [Rhodococcus sp. (in: high G+C Gram-positive bacteria)]
MSPEHHDHEHHDHEHHDHAHQNHDNHADATENPFAKADAQFWNSLYEERPARWSGNPNPQLIAEASDLAPGTALDVGCGEGADALWLARRGWKVTGTDISSVALSRAKAHVEGSGVDIEWLEADLTKWDPQGRSFDLVSAQFFHMLEPARGELFRALGELVAPGGHLLIVGHSPHESPTEHHRAMLHTPDYVESLFTDGWKVLVSESRERDLPANPEMHHTTDTVVLLQRLSASTDSSS